MASNTHLRTKPSTGQCVPAAAFSLVEMIVVVAVIGVLAVLMLPGITRVRNSTMQSTCSSNLRQIASALFAYAADNDGTIPGPAEQWGPSGDKQTWAYKIWSYAGYDPTKYVTGTWDISWRAGVTGKNIFRCPANARGFTPVPTATATPSPNRFSYGMNPGPMGDDSTGWKTPIALARVASTSRTVMVTEDSYCLGSRTGFFLYYGLMPHNSGSNFLFFDGHVEYLPYTETAKLRSDKTFWGN